MCYKQPYICKQGHDLIPDIRYCKDAHFCFIRNKIIVGEPILSEREQCQYCCGVPESIIRFYRETGLEIASGLTWRHEYDAEMFVALFSQRALGDWKTRSLEWQQSGRLGKQKKRWTPKEKEDAKLSAVEPMKPEHRPIVAPQESSTRLTTAGQTKSATQRQAKNAANKYTWSHDEARSAFEAAYVRHALELHERRLAQYPDGKLPRIKISDKLDILGHVTKELHTLFDDEKLPLKLQRLFTQGVSVGGAGGSDDSHAQGSTATKTFQTTINPKEGRRLEDSKTYQTIILWATTAREGLVSLA
jgi:hypothetical protein